MLAVIKSYDNVQLIHSYIYWYYSTGFMFLFYHFLATF